MSRKNILSALAESAIESQPLPELSELTGLWQSPARPLAAFRQALEASGGVLVEVDDEAELAATIHDHYPQDGRIYTNLPELRESFGCNKAPVSPHEMEDTQLAVVRGNLGVAENGSVWVSDNDLEHRVVCFITQHLALVLKRQEMVGTLLEAYQQLTLNSQNFGCFIAGPSKTGDIEHTLVFGAHGARSHTVFLI